MALMPDTTTREQLMLDEVTRNAVSARYDDATLARTYEPLPCLSCDLEGLSPTECDRRHR